MEMMGTHEIRQRLGNVSRQRAYQITNHPTFPKPVTELAQGKIWDAGQVDEWIHDHRQRRPTGLHPMSRD
jgi:prophage regulatory protein